VTSGDYPDPAARAAAQQQFEDAAMLQLQELKDYFGDDAAEIWFDAGIKQSGAFLDRVNKWIAAQLPLATCHSCQNLPDPHLVSWMGNENTVMPYGSTGVWNANTEDCGLNGVGTSRFGTPYGTRFCAAHCDAVLRNHFWFWDQQTYDNPSNLNSASRLLAMHMTSIGRGCNMILDMSPTDTGLLQQNDVQTYAQYGAGLQALYSQPVAQWLNAPGATTSPAVVQFGLSGGNTSSAVLLRGGVELRENMENGQTIRAYAVQYCASADGCGGGAAGQRGGSRAPAAGVWRTLELRNQKQITIGNRRIHWFSYPTGISPGSFRVSLSTLAAPGGGVYPPCLRSAKVFDWSDSSFDQLLVDIGKVR
jgi:hypothetical protein